MILHSTGYEGSEEEEEEECETMTIGESVRDDLYDEKVDEEAEEKMLEKYKQQRLEEMFPDEVDTPVAWLLEFGESNKSKINQYILFKTYMAQNYVSAI